MQKELQPLQSTFLCSPLSLSGVHIRPEYAALQRVQVIAKEHIQALRSHF